MRSTLVIVLLAAATVAVFGQAHVSVNDVTIDPATQATLDSGIIRGAKPANLIPAKVFDWDAVVAAVEPVDPRVPIIGAAPASLTPVWVTRELHRDSEHPWEDEELNGHLKHHKRHHHHHHHHRHHHRRNHTHRYDTELRDSLSAIAPEPCVNPQAVFDPLASLPPVLARLRDSLDASAPAPCEHHRHHHHRHHHHHAKHITPEYKEHHHERHHHHKHAEPCANEHHHHHHHRHHKELVKPQYRHHEHHHGLTRRERLAARHHHRHHAAAAQPTDFETVNFIPHSDDGSSAPVVDSSDDAGFEVEESSDAEATPVVAPAVPDFGDVSEPAQFAEQFQPSDDADNTDTSVQEDADKDAAEGVASDDAADPAAADPAEIFDDNDSSVQEDADKDVAESNTNGFDGSDGAADVTDSTASEDSAKDAAETLVSE